MRKFLILFSYTISSFYQPTWLYAEVTNTQCETALNCLSRPQNNAPPGTSSDRPITGFTDTTTGSQVGSAGEAGSGVYEQAKEGREQSNNTMMIALVMAAMFAAQCGPHNPTACMLAAAALAAAMMANQKKQQSQALMDKLGTENDTKVRPEDQKNTTGGVADPDKDFSVVKKDLLGKGYKVNSDGSITIPNGNTVDGNLNAESMSDAGMNAATVSGVQSGLSKMRKDMDKKEDLNDLSGRTSLASMGAGSTSETSGGGAGTSVNGADKVDASRDPAAWDGFYKQFGDSLIGVGQNDIFLMVEKRVESERKIMGQ